MDYLTQTIKNPFRVDQRGAACNMKLVIAFVGFLGRYPVQKIDVSW